MIPPRYLALAASLFLPAIASAQQGARSASATLRVTAFVAPVLRIEAITPSQLLSAASTWGSTLASRANVEHRVVVRPAHGATVTLRGPTGGWVTVTAAAPLHFAGALGDVAHRIECRGSLQACMLTFELRSTDMQFPIRVTSSVGPVAGGAAVTSAATSS